jgi:hypothetical protein
MLLENSVLWPRPIATNVPTVGIEDHAIPGADAFVPQGNT